MLKNMVSIKKGSLVLRTGEKEPIKILTKPGLGEYPDEFVEILGLTHGASCKDFVLCSVPTKSEEYYRIYHYNNMPCIICSMKDLTAYKKQ